MRTVWKVLLSFVVVPALIVGIFYALNKNGYFNLTRVDISIEKSIRQKLVLKKSVERLQSDLSAYKGQSLWNLKLKLLKERVQKENWVETFRLVRQWPSTLEVQVVASPVYFVYLNNRGEFFPVMENGKILDAVEAGETPDVPIVRDVVFQKDPELRKQLIRLLKDVPLRGSFSRGQISEIHYDVKNGFSFTLIRDGLVVKIGDEQVRTKSLRVSKVLDYLENKKFQARVIDANLSQKVLVRLRKEP